MIPAGVHQLQDTPADLYRLFRAMDLGDRRVEARLTFIRFGLLFCAVGGTATLLLTIIISHYRAAVLLPIFVGLLLLRQRARWSPLDLADERVAETMSFLRKLNVRWPESRAKLRVDTRGYERGGQRSHRRWHWHSSWSKGLQVGRRFHMDHEWLTVWGRFPGGQSYALSVLDRVERRIAYTLGSPHGGIAIRFPLLYVTVGREVSDTISSHVRLRAEGLADESPSIAGLARRLRDDLPAKMHSLRVSEEKQSLSCALETLDASRLSVLGKEVEQTGMENLMSGTDIDEILGWAAAALATENGLGPERRSST